MGATSRHGWGSALALTAALALAGCSGSGASADEEEKAETTVRTLVSACAREEGAVVDHLLTEDVRRRFIDADSTLEGCAVALAPEGRLDELPAPELKRALEEAEVVETDANAGFASVRVTSGAALDTTVELSLLRGRWYVSNAG